MSLFILDTDTLTFLDHNHPVVQSAVESALDAGHTIALTAVTVEEQIDGWFKLFRKAKNNAQLAHAPQTEASLDRFDALVAMKLNVGKMDLRIASIALEAEAIVVTHNSRDFGRVPALPTAD